MSLSKTISFWIRTINIMFVVLISMSYDNELNAQNNDLEITPKTHIANYTKEPINIDGLANEGAWIKASYSEVFIDIEGIKKPKYNTKFKMLWDEKYIYFLAELEDPHVWANLKKRDTIIFHNNDFEIFIDPNGDTHNYYEFEFNALNTLWDLFITKPYREQNAVLNDWNANGLKSAVHVDGTLNNPNDTDKKWSIEIAIPLTVFKTSYFEKIGLVDHFWRMNFSRVHWDFQLENGVYQRKKNVEGKLAHENNWVWSPQGVVAMHQPETWGYVYFSSKEVGETDEFIIPNDEKIKWKLFKLYKAQKIFYKLNKSWSKSIQDLNINMLIDNKELKPVLENHSTGWNISIKSPFSKKILIIKEDGEFISK